MILNLGCGYNKVIRPDVVNVDCDMNCSPDVLLDLENNMWPWPDSSVSEVHLTHVLEHLGQTTKQYFHVIKELYRVCAHAAKVVIIVPHFRHDNFFHDATHVRAITPEGLVMFNQARNRDVIANKGRETTLGIMLGVDFQLKNIENRLEKVYYDMMEAKTLSNEQMGEIARNFNNTIQEVLIELEVIKS